MREDTDDDASHDDNDDIVDLPLNDIQGWLTLAQANVLYHAARRVADGHDGTSWATPISIVEIGSFHGRSTVSLVFGSSLLTDDTDDTDADVKVIAIDPHAGGDRGPQEITPDEVRGNADYDTFHANLAKAGIAHKVHHIRKSSQQAFADGDAPEQIALLFIDGAHRIKPAGYDIKQWRTKIPVGGTMLIHDAFSSIGVTTALALTCFASRHWRYIKRTGSLAEYRRVPKMSRKAQLTNLTHQLTQLPYFAKNLLLKIFILTTRSARPWPH